MHRDYEHTLNETQLLNLKDQTARLLHEEVRGLVRKQLAAAEAEPAVADEPDSTWHTVTSTLRHFIEQVTGSPLKSDSPPAEAPRTKVQGQAGSSW